MTFPLIPPTADKSPMLIHCRTCGHVWPFIWTPCLAANIARHRNPACPVCGARGKQLVMASKEAGHLGLYVQFLERELERARKEAA